MNEDMVMVNVSGVEFPVFTDQIDFPYFKRFSEQSKREKERRQNMKVYVDHIPEERTVQQPGPDNGVHLSFFPVYVNPASSDEVAHFKAYLVNQNNEPYQFEYHVLYRGHDSFMVRNEIRPSSDFYLHNIPQEDFNDIVKFQVRFSLLTPEKNREDVVEKTIRIKARTLFQKIEEMHQLNVPSFSFELFFRYPEKKPAPYFPLPEKNTLAPPPSARAELPPTVIDLHIEQLTPSFRGMSNYEIMMIQLAHFEKYLQLAVAHMQPKLTVIHGVGTGRLRNEIHELLRTKKEVKSFVNQYHPNFGFGATEIYFQY